MEENNFLELRLALKSKENDYNKTQEILGRYDQAEIAYFLQNTDECTRKLFIKRHLSDYAEIIPELEDDVIVEIAEIISERKFANIIKNLPADEIVYILESLDEEKTQNILFFLPTKLKIVLEEILSYPEESAGRLIDKEFIVIPKSWNVDQALQLIKSHKKLPKDLNEIYVIDQDYKPVGSIKLADLLRFKRKVKIENIMQTEVKTIEAGRARDEVIRLFQDYSLISMPVVDSDGRITGIITLEDVIDVISEEAEEDILHVGRISESDLRANITSTVFGRIKWLIITFMSINISSFILGLFQKTLQAHVEIAILMPIIAAMGGNAGIQASTVSLRGIVSNQLSDKSAARLFRKEMVVGFINGLIMSMLVMGVIFLRFHNLRLELTFLCAVTLVFTLATSIGSAIPLIVEKLGGDSALSSSIITSSFTDILAFAVLLTTATLILS